jgi:hypothetical protein
MNVLTKNGLIPRADLEVIDEIVEESNARVFVTEWRHHGELVRRDVNVNILAGVELAGEQQAV